jgi:hypothetical protein
VSSPDQSLEKKSKTEGETERLKALLLANRQLLASTLLPKTNMSGGFGITITSPDGTTNSVSPAASPNRMRQAAEAIASTITAARSLSASPVPAASTLLGSRPQSPFGTSVPTSAASSPLPQSASAKSLNLSPNPSSVEAVSAFAATRSVAAAFNLATAAMDFDAAADQVCIRPTSSSASFGRETALRCKSLMWDGNSWTVCMLRLLPTRLLPGA